MIKEYPSKYACLGSKLLKYLIIDFPLRECLPCVITYFAESISVFVRKTFWCTRSWWKYEVEEGKLVNHWVYSFRFLAGKVSCLNF